MKSPAEIAAFTSDVGVVKSKLGIPRMIALGFLAGFFIALAGAASNTASALISNASVAKIISGCVFPAGLTMVLCAGSELFTGNSLMAVALLDKRIKLRHMLKNWLFVYVGNYVGSVLAAALLSLSGQFGMFGGKEKTVKLLVDNRLAGVIIDRFGKDIMLIPADENHFTVNVDVHVSKQFLGWVFSLGEQVKILSPEDVVEQMQGEVKRLVEQYGE